MSAFVGKWACNLETAGRRAAYQPLVFPSLMSLVKLIFLYTAQKVKGYFEIFYFLCCFVNWP